MKYYYHNADKNLSDTDNRDGKPLPPDVTAQQAANELYDRLGGTIPITWQRGYKGEPEIDIPDSISKSDVETILNNMQSEDLI